MTLPHGWPGIRAWSSFSPRSMAAGQVEIWFGILSRGALRHRSFDGVDQLASAIYRFTAHWNKTMAHPFEWTYTGKVLNA